MITIFRSRVIKRVVLPASCILTVGLLMWVVVNRHAPLETAVGKYNVSHVTDGRNTKSEGPPILLWWDSVYTRVDEVKLCGKNKCRVTNNRTLQGHADTKVFLFYGSHFKPYNLPVPRSPNHIWALIHEESPRNAYILSHGKSMSIFNITSTYNRHSHYPITTQWLQCPEWIHDKTYMLPLVDKNRLRGAGLAPILYLHSDCGVPSDRDSYLKLLQQYIPVDSYGSCVNNKKMPETLRFRDSMAPLDDKAFFRFAARYKFTLSFENFVCEDYVTEKFWRPIRIGSVPIVFGAPNIRDYLPSNKSAILVEDFADIEDLAQYIRLLDQNDRLYKEYLKYKDEPIANKILLNQIHNRDWEPEFCGYSKNIHLKSIKKTNKPNSIFSGYECYLCNIANKAVKERDYDKSPITYSAYQSQYHCPSPRQFDSNGKYSVMSDFWSAEWRNGRYEAEVLNELHNKNVRVSKKEFVRMVKAAIDDTSDTSN